MELQSLQIPQGWFIDYNQFYDITPSKINVEDISTYFNEDILQFTHKKNNQMIDLGWYPEHIWKEGAFKLVVYEGNFHGKLLYELRTKDKTKIVNEINRLLLNEFKKEEQ